ncbi:MAG: DUF2975 domain-containing protein [Bacteroides sp.]|nr:DUF2975 domain-containing protein [Bacteroides sp.]
METNISKIKKNQHELKVILVCLPIICVCCLFMFVINGISMIYENEEGSLTLYEIIATIATLCSMAICSMLIFPILNNTRHGKVFIKANATLIGAIGAILEVNGFIQSIFAYNHGTHLIYFLIGVFFLFIACVFRLGIQMKEEQDLTI